MKKIKYFFVLVYISLFLLFASACSNSANQKVNEAKDSLATVNDTATSSTQDIENDTTIISDSSTAISASITDRPSVLIYNFHITNRCASCIAIEEATTKTLNTYFAAEMKQGRITRQILNVDEEANKAISEKYQAFGSGLFVTRVFKGKETTTDLTGDGFKYAKNREEKFIEILKNTISGYLK
jgi:hypothetical protein